MAQINEFLGETKGKSVEVNVFFPPDLDKFVSSVVQARRISSY